MAAQLTSFADCSRRSFLSAVLKASRVLVLYRVPMAGQQRAGVGALLDVRQTVTQHDWEPERSVR